MKRFLSPFNRITGSAITLLMISGTLLSQPLKEREMIEQAASGWWFYVGLTVVLVVGLAAFVFRRFLPKTAVKDASDARDTTYYNSNESYEMDGLDVDQELEWLRKVKKNSVKNKPAMSAGLPRIEIRPTQKFSGATGAIDLDTRAFQEKMRKLQYVQLPINSFLSLRPARPFEDFPTSNDESLLNAIEQVSDEYEEDEAVRELALKILAAFRTRNSVEALTQIALYDLSSNLRSRAVTTLADFDHPSVFEPLLLACADPTREVRAAAARGLFRLSFDRGDSWKRIMETGDEFRTIHAARAAIESEIATKSFDRLVHEDLKVANEAFSLVAFIIKSGETDEIFKSIREHKDERIKFALLHVLRVINDERTVSKLEELQKTGKFSPDVKERISETINSFEGVMA